MTPNRKLLLPTGRYSVFGIRSQLPPTAMNVKNATTASLRVVVAIIHATVAPTRFTKAEAQRTRPQRFCGFGEGHRLRETPWRSARCERRATG